MFKELSPDQLNNIKNTIEKYDNIIRLTRDKLLEERIKQLEREQEADDEGAITDSLDVYIAEKVQSNITTCLDCGEEME